MNKGFATIIVSIAVLVTTIVLLSMNYSSSEISYIEELSETKTILNNYQITLNHISQDCNWEKSTIEIKNCIDTNSDLIINSLELNGNSWLECNNPSFAVSGNIAQGFLICHFSRDFSATQFELDLNKIVEIRKE